MLEPLPAIIRMAREQQNLTPAALARKSGVSRRTIGDLENGRINISVGLLVKLARALQLSDLQIGDLRMRAAPPEFEPLRRMQHEIVMARQALHLTQAELARVRERLEQIAPQLALVMDPDDARAFMESVLELERAAIQNLTQAVAPVRREAPSPDRLRF